VQPSVSLLPCLLTSRTVYTISIGIMYREAIISRPSTFSSFSNQLQSYPESGKAVRRIALLSLSPACSGFCVPLYECLGSTPLLREFRTRHSLNMDKKVLQTLLCGLPHLETLEISCCSSEDFDVAVTEILDDPESTISVSIQDLKLGGVLSPSIFEALLPRLPKLLSLDLKEVQIAIEALEAIPGSARLTHLNLSCCHLLHGQDLVRFLCSHPSVKSTLVTLAVECTPNNPILDEEDISKLLVNVAPTLRSLNLKNSPMTSTHLPLLQKLHLRSLCVGSALRLRDVESLFVPFEFLGHEETTSEQAGTELEKDVVSYLKPMEEAVAVCKMQQRLHSIPATSASCGNLRLEYLDISCLPAVERGKLGSSVLLGQSTLPLRVIEISDYFGPRKAVLERVFDSVGWDVKSNGKRSWLVRRNKQ
jgi:hypothetical protein